MKIKSEAKIITIIIMMSYSVQMGKEQIINLKKKKKKKRAQNSQLLTHNNINNS